MDAKDPIGRAFFLRGGPHGCLLLHGFTGTAGHVRWLGQKLNDSGYTVSAPLLPGHGETLTAMRESNWRQWLAAARTSYVDLRKQCEQVSVMGLSMGGALALILAEEYPVDSLVCMSAALRIRMRFGRLAPLMALVSPYRNWDGAEPRPKRRDFLYEYDCGYEGLPVAKVRDLLRVMHRAERNLFAVVAPALIIQPVHDQTVNPRSADIIFQGISSKQKQLVRLPESSHMCTLDCDREQLLYSVLKHLRHTDATKPLAL